jgi:adenylate kinase family enzyme
VELDAIFWQPDWTELPPDQLRSEVARKLVAESWVVDGNYTSRLGTMILAAADTVVWLDLPRRQVMSAVTRRTLYRGLRRRELWNGNRERLRNIVKWKPEENIVRWAWVNHRKLRDRYETLRGEYADLNWVRLRSRREVDTWLRKVAPSG